MLSDMKCDGVGGTFDQIILLTTENMPDLQEFT